MQATQSAAPAVTTQDPIPASSSENAQGTLLGRDVVQSLPEASEKTRNLIIKLGGDVVCERVLPASALAALGPQKTALSKHVAFFADSDGKITQSSIYTAFCKLGFSYFESFTKSVAISSIAGGIIHSCPFAKVASNDIHKMVHPCHSGVFKEDGTIDIAAWEKLKSYAQPEKEFLSGPDIERMQNEAIARDKEKDPIGIWKVASQGEWADLLRIACDHWELINAEYVPCITFTTLWSMFNDGASVFERVELGELPVKKPASAPV
jgi:hypothetical protein